MSTENENQSKIKKDLKKDVAKGTDIRWFIYAIEVVVIAAFVYFQKNPPKFEAYPISPPICRKDIDYDQLDGASILVLGRKVGVDHEKKDVFIDEVVLNRARSVSTLYTNIFLNTQTIPEVYITGGDSKNIGYSDAEMMHMVLTNLVPDDIRILNENHEVETYTMTKAKNTFMKITPEPKITKEYMSYNTLQGAIYMRKLLTNSTKVILVTSEYHMPRAKYIYRCLMSQDKENKLDIIPSPCMYMDPKVSYDNVDLNSLYQSNSLNEPKLNNLQMLEYERLKLKEDGESLIKSFGTENCDYSSAFRELDQIQDAFIKRYG